MDHEQTDRLPPGQASDGSGQDRRQAGHRERIKARVWCCHGHSQKPLPIYVLSQLMGQTGRKTTEIYLQVVGDEERQMVSDTWEG